MRMAPAGRIAVLDGLRTESAVSFNEYRDLSVQPIFQLQITGNF
jgi:hypothetical protein